ncbi:hypothetical protein C8R47DRAFT_168207 [Mycena vitilis]|nr:hypothetical protein C8R47DRAFT_168207 [Mycena vitilis]
MHEGSVSHLKRTVARFPLLCASALISLTSPPSALSPFSTHVPTRASTCLFMARFIQSHRIAFVPGPEWNGRDVELNKVARLSCARVRDPRCCLCIKAKADPCYDRHWNNRRRPTIFTRREGQSPRAKKSYIASSSRRHIPDRQCRGPKTSKLTHKQDWNKQRRRPGTKEEGHVTKLFSPSLIVGSNSLQRTPNLPVHALEGGHLHKKNAMYFPNQRRQSRTGKSVTLLKTVRRQRDADVRAST